MPYINFSPFFGIQPKEPRHLSIDSSTFPINKNPHSYWGNIVAKGSDAEKLTLSSAKAQQEVQLHKVIVQGNVLSRFGNIVAHKSTLNNAAAYRNIFFVDSSGKDLSSVFGNIIIQSKSNVLSEFSNIKAPHLIDIHQASVTGKIESVFGDINAKQSKLTRVSAGSNITLIDSSAKDIISHLGNVTVQQTDGSSQISSIKACYNITMINSSADHISSRVGRIEIIQKDGVQRPISDITGHKDIIVHNSLVENITLRNVPGQQALLDLTNTVVTGKVTVQTKHFVLKTIQNNAITASAPHSLPHFLLACFCKQYPEFQVLIKGEMPKNICFEGFEPHEITFQPTDNGTLVIGKK